MKKNKFTLFVLGTLCTLSVYSQEEFFKNNTGLSVSGSTDFSYVYGGGLSLHLKNGVIFSGSHDESHDESLTSIGIGYIARNKNNINGIEGIIDLSYGFMSDGYKMAGVNMGLNQMFFSKSNSPFSIRASVSFLTSTYYNKLGLTIVPTIGYTQSFFVNNPIYPVIGITYSLPMNHSYDSNEMGFFLFHVGLNIKLSNADTKR
jgi:hypothetical protein